MRRFSSETRPRDSPGVELVTKLGSSSLGDLRCCGLSHLAAMARKYWHILRYWRFLLCKGLRKLTIIGKKQYFVPCFSLHEWFECYLTRVRTKQRNIEEWDKSSVDNTLYITAYYCYAVKYVYWIVVVYVVNVRAFFASSIRYVFSLDVFI